MPFSIPSLLSFKASEGDGVHQLPPGVVGIYLVYVAVGVGDGRPELPHTPEESAGDRPYSFYHASILSSYCMNIYKLESPHLARRAFWVRYSSVVVMWVSAVAISCMYLVVRLLVVIASATACGVPL